ncbi:MAG TPA: hypothetical protein VN026_08695 [Bacteroidia bacterium]|jgi:hypothetical protein|nr:hypothetical protein [Bacteroidia bacterium]
MKNFKYIFLIICALSFFGCKKNQLGGYSDIKGKVTHHGVAIPFSRVYIKYNATDFPGADITVYNTYIDADQNGNFEIKKIYHGQYYFYAVGYDNSISSTVTGGVALKVKMFKEVTGFVVPVTE